MRKLIVSLSLTTVLAVGILLLPTAIHVQASGTEMVANQQGCLIFSGDKTYEGSGTEVLTPSGHWTYTCNAELIDGPDVNGTIHTEGTCSGSEGFGEGDFVLNPGGQAHANCHF
jgi:hypothetical protein